MAERPARLRAALVGTALALVAGGLLLARTVPESEPVGRAAGEGAALREVSTLRVRALPVRSQARVSGVLAPRRSVQLHAETRGPVVALGAEELDRVDAGQLLVAIDPLRAEVDLERAEAAVTRRRSELALARSNLERRRSLAERGVSSASELDDALNAERVAAAALREAQAERTRARDELTKKNIAAPFAGVLRSFPVEVGEYVGEGQQVAELLDLRTVRASIGLSDREVVAVRPGEGVQVAVEAYPGERFAGTILRVGGASDPDTRKFPVEVELPNPERRLMPGMVASVAFDLGAATPRTVIPRDATLDEFGLRVVYVVEGDGEAWVARRRRVVVRPLPFQPGDLEVVEGLAEGEEIALTAIHQLRDGEPVRHGGAADAAVSAGPGGGGETRRADAGGAL